MAAHTTVNGRVGEFKLIVGSPGDSRYLKWPAPGSVMPFGQSGGEVEEGTNHCRAKVRVKGSIPCLPPVRRITRSATHCTRILWCS